jgi:hypothetical protein
MKNFFLNLKIKNYRKENFHGLQIINIWKSFIKGSVCFFGGNDLAIVIV